MKCLKRNKRTFYCCLYEGKRKGTDEDGFYAGEETPVYSEPIAFQGNISSAKGETEIELFGSSLQYDKVIVLDDVHSPIDENTVLFIDKEPSFDSFGNPLFDYIIKRVARSLNSVSYAIERVKVN